MTYIPTKEGYLLTSNRDEQRGRAPALAPALYNGLTGRLLYPRDALAGGTWFVMHERGHAVVLLNGGWERHTPEPPYRKSRGLVLLELADSDNPLQTFRGISLDKIEPFTLVLTNFAGPSTNLGGSSTNLAGSSTNLAGSSVDLPGSSTNQAGSPAGTLYECRWDGREKYIERLDAALPHIWSSVTLYGPAMAARRQSWFQSWIRAYPAPDQSAILDFHRFTGDGDPQSDLLMNRDDRMLTVSITSLELRRAASSDQAALTASPDRSSAPGLAGTGPSARMVYQDTLSGATARQELFTIPPIPHTA